MKNGFRLLYKLLLEFYFRTPGAVGLVLSGGRKVYNFLKSREFNVEYGTNNPRYNFIYIPTKKYSLETLEKCLTLLANRGIIIARVKEVDLEKLLRFIGWSDYYLQTNIHSINKEFSYLWIYMEGRKNEFKY